MATRKIYIGFSSPTTSFAPFASLIKWVESRPYDHVYIRLQEPMDSDYMIFQVSKEMVNLYNKDIFQAANMSHKEYELDITDEQYIELWKYVKSHLGIPYSLKEDLGILFMKIFKTKTNMFDNGMSATFCSEMGADVCKMLGIKIDLQLSTVDPTMLDSILQSNSLPVQTSPKF